MSALTQQRTEARVAMSGAGPSRGCPEGSFRILLFHWNADLYGASRSLLRLCSRLVKEGHVPVVVLGMRGPLAAALSARGVEVRHTKWMAAIERSSLRSLAGITGLVLRILVSVPTSMMRIAQEKPDLVHTNASVILTSGIAARLMGRPHVWHIRETFTEYPRLWRIHRRLVALVSNRIVCISECVASQFAEAVRGRQVTVVHNGIPAEEIVAPDPERLSRVREELGLGDLPTVGVVGRINLERKGQDVLVRASVSLLESHPDARFLIVGGAYPGNEGEVLRLRSLIRASGVEDRFILVGEIQDLAVIYGLLDILVVPSPVPEPFGNTAPEAMAYGLPVVGSDLGGTAEILEHGKTGLLFPPGDPKALAACLDLLLSDEAVRHELAAAGQRAFRDRFEFDRCYSRLEDVLASCVGPRPSMKWGA